MYDGMCAICDCAHIRVGDKIVRYSSSWAHCDCKAALLRLGDSVSRIQDEMAKKGFAFGIAPAMSQMQTTGTRAQFYGIAERLGLISAAELADLSRTQRLLWNHSLTD